MPLPINSSLSLLGPSRLGDALPSKPKKAMLVRLSPETLDALEASNQPQVQFEFGENPGVFIGQSYFPMAHLQENSIHELYLRAPSATKRNAPLKLYANVIGKFTVEKREIGDDLRDKIRESTQDAAKEKSSRATVFMSSLPDPQTAKKRKEPSNNMFRKALRPTDKLPKTMPSSTPPPAQKTPSTASASASQTSGVPVRWRFIQCLAKGEKSEEELFKLLGVSDRNPNLQSEISDLLDQLVDSRREKSQKFYSLKSLAWKEARPFEYSGLSEQERVQMARSGMAALKTLRIPDNDPLWDHFRIKNSATSSLTNTQALAPSESPRAPPSTPSVDPRNSLQDVPKRGISSRELKEKKAKIKPEPVPEIQMKDESQKASSSRLRPDSSMESRRPSDAPREQAPARRQPLPTKPRPSNRDNVERSVSADRQPLARRAEKEQISHTKTANSKDTHFAGTKVRRNHDAFASDSERGTPGPSGERTRTKERPVKREVQEDDYNDTKSKSTKRREVKEENEDRVKRRGNEIEKPLKRKPKREEELDEHRSSSKRRAQDSPGKTRSSTKTRPVEEDYHQEPRKRRAPEDEFTEQRSSSKRRARDDEDDYDDKSRTMSRQRSWEDGSNSSKRKIADPEDSYHESTRPKKRKIERDPVSSSISLQQEDRDRKDLLPSRKAHPDRVETETRPKAKSTQPTSSQARNPSPPVNRPSASSRESVETRSTEFDHSLPSNLRNSKMSSSNKTRRRSPVYTSSDEDEKDDDLPLSKRLSAKNTKATPSSNNIRPSHQSRNAPPRTLPSDHAGLRTLYNTTYLDYLTNMQKLLVQKGKIDSLLKSGDLNSSGSVTDSDGDVELLQPEELETLSANHKRLHAELKDIHDAYDQTVDAD